MRTLKLFGLLLLFVLQILGKVYYVDNQNPQASDDNPGTLQLPFKTIDKAAQVVEPGDIVIVKPGIYREHIKLARSGKPGAPISFIAEPPHSVIVSGADIVKGWRKIEGKEPIYAVKWEHRFVINVRPDGSLVEHHPDDEEHKLWGRAELVLVDGKLCLPALTVDDLRKAWNLHREAIQKGEASPVLKPPLPNLGGPFAGMFCADTKNKILYLWLADGSDPESHQVECATRGELFGLSPWENPQGVQFVYVRGFIFRHAATFPQRAAVWLQGANNILEDCIIEEMAGGGVMVNGTMRRCIIRRCGHTGGGAMGENFLNEDDIWEENCWKPINRGWDAGGFKLALAKNGIFRNCVFRHNGGPGLWFDIDVKDVVVTNCLFYENEHHGLFIEISRKITVLNNLFIRNGVGIVGKVEWPDWCIAGLTIAESQDCLVARNTFYGNKDGIAFREQGPRLLNTEDGEIAFHNKSNIVVKNILANNKGYQLALWYDNAFFGWHPAEKEKFKDESSYEAYLKNHPELIFNPREQEMTIDYNLYYPEKGEKLILYGVPWRPKYKEFQNLENWSREIGFDSHSIFANPLFLNPQDDDFRLKPTSPALKLGAGCIHPPTFK
ncbi:right-handed parallel beta-helix repeat-containing protein [bacterium]|nr:right-handed parallel beta-helix repeat-containing protein [bacterium]